MRAYLARMNAVAMRSFTPLMIELSLLVGAVKVRFKSLLSSSRLIFFIAVLIESHGIGFGINLYARFIFDNCFLFFGFSVYC